MNWDSFLLAFNLFRLLFMRIAKTVFKSQIKSFANENRTGSVVSPITVTHLKVFVAISVNMNCIRTASVYPIRDVVSNGNLSIIKKNYQMFWHHNLCVFTCNFRYEIRAVCTCQFVQSKMCGKEGNFWCTIICSYKKRVWAI